MVNEENRKLMRKKKTPINFKEKNKPFLSSGIVFDKEDIYDIIQSRYKLLEHVDTADHFQKKVDWKRFMEDPDMFLQFIFIEIGHLHNALANVSECLAMSMGILDYLNDEIIYKIPDKNDVIVMKKQLTLYRRALKEASKKLKEDAPYIKYQRDIMDYEAKNNLTKR